MDQLKTPSSFIALRPATPTALPTKLNVNSILPYAFELFAKEVGAHGMGARLPPIDEQKVAL